VLAPGLTDHAHFCSTATGIVACNGGRRARRYVGFTRGRVSESRTHNVEYSEFAAWAREIDQGLRDGARRPPDLFARYAAFVAVPRDPTPTSILLDLEEIDALDLEYRAARDARLIPIRFDDVCWEVANGAFEAVAGSLRCHATVQFMQGRGEYEIASREL